MLKIAYSWLLNAQFTRTAIWISTWKLYFSSTVAAWLISRHLLHRASFGTLTGRRRGNARRRGGHHSPLLLAQELLVPAEGLAAPGQPC